MSQNPKQSTAFRTKRQSKRNVSNMPQHAASSVPSHADFNLDFYTEVQDLGYLAKAMGNRPFSQRFKYVHCIALSFKLQLTNLN